MNDKNLTDFFFMIFLRYTFTQNKIIETLLIIQFWKGNVKTQILKIKELYLMKKAWNPNMKFAPCVTCMIIDMHTMLCQQACIQASV